MGSGFRLEMLWVLALGTLVGACSPAVEKLWEFPTGSPLYSTPLVVDELIVFGSEGGTLHAVDRKGQARWRYSIPSGEIFSHPQTDGKLVFFGATNQKFYALDMSGQVRWQFAARERIKSDPTVSEGVVYTSSYDGHIYALKADSGKLVWQFPAEQDKKDKPADKAEGAAEGEKAKGDKPADDKPADDKPEGDKAAEGKEPSGPGAFSYAAPVIRDGVLYVGNLDGSFYALNTADGTLKWCFKTGGGITSTALVEGGTVYFGSKDDHVYAIDSATGTKVKWKFKTTDDVLSSPQLVDGVVYIGSNDKNLYAIDAETGKEKCHFSSQGQIISYAVPYKDLVFFNGGQGDGCVYAIEAASCKLFYRYKTGYKIESDPVFDGDRFYVTSGDNKLYAFKVNKTAKQ
ncbi:MAG: PQQ-binding-like beta-propeller repeat protein [Deltaproteobacteria bacterium]|nr:PQQ-binding-like beta-propeller repeat protein [Deltaproteobacteria bacterium]